MPRCSHAAAEGCEPWVPPPPLGPTTDKIGADPIVQQHASSTADSMKHGKAGDGSKAGVWWWCGGFDCRQGSSGGIGVQKPARSSLRLRLCPTAPPKS
jgi:hypothetical protein